MNNQKYFPAIDGLRALSIFLVICFHCHYYSLNPSVLGFIRRMFESGDIGVDCFFVISGFLITGILLSTKNKPNYYKNFFFRRVLRIFPLYYAILILAFIILPQFDHPMKEKWAGIDQKWYWLYLSNFEIASRSKLFHGMVDLSWSLSIEEQFYFVWPWIVLFFNDKKLKIICFSGILLSLFSKIYMYINEYSSHMIHFSTINRLEPIMLGSLTALLYRYYSINQLQKYFKPIGIFAFIFYALSNWFSRFMPTIFYFSFNYLLVAIFFNYILIESLNEKTFFYRLFSKKALINIGKYCYGIYLFHNPIQSALRKFVFNQYMETENIFAFYSMQFLFVLMTLLISYLIAWISYHAFEKQFLSLKKHFVG